MFHHLCKCTGLFQIIICIVFGVLLKVLDHAQTKSGGILYNPQKKKMKHKIHHQTNQNWR